MEAHELTHIRLEALARNQSRNRWFATTAASRELAIRSLAPDIKKLERKGYSDDSITQVVLELVGGLSACIFNTPLDMWIEVLLHREMPALRHAQFVSLHRLAVESLSDSEDAKKKDFLNRLEKVASDVTDKQMLVLAEVGQKFDSTIDLKAVHDHPESIDADKRTLTLNGIVRTFRLLPLKVDFESRELQFRLEMSTPESPEPNSYEFWVGFYDFPMIDNTRLAHDLRCAVVLNTFEEERAEATLIYFPGSRASLKEKPFYEDVIANLQATPASNTKR